MINKNEIIAHLPYAPLFLFVDEIISVSTESISGSYKFTKDLYFYKGHFINNPITPGVILTECMAQIGLVCLGIYLLEDKADADKFSFALSSTKIDFFAPVFPGEMVKVISNKVYFRFNKLKCDVKMLNQDGKLVASGIIDGMLIPIVSQSSSL